MRRRARAVLGTSLVWGALLGAGCGDPPAPRERPAARPSDKAALYGDAALVPTREGERARAEVALAEELRAALETLHAVEKARATVTTEHGERPTSAAVIIRARPGSDRSALDSTARRIARGILGEEDVSLEVEVSAPSVDVPPEDSPSAPRPIVLFAVLGLGISLGLTFDRARTLLRARR